jgi:hypothetical protein
LITIPDSLGEFYFFLCRQHLLLADLLEILFKGGTLTVGD